MIRPHKVGQLTHKPESVCLKFAAGEPNRCASTYSTLTPVPVLIFKRNTCGSYCHTYIINRIADKIEHTGGNLCRFGILENFCYLYVTIDGRAYRKRHVHLYIPGLERCSPMDAMPDIQAITNKKRYLNQKDRNTVSGITMKNLLLNAERTATV